MRIAKYSHDKERTFCINLSAPFLSQFFTDRLLKAIPYVDILFGNDDVSETQITIKISFAF
jgi:adenosine kinase